MKKFIVTVDVSVQGFPFFEVVVGRFFAKNEELAIEQAELIYKEIIKNSDKKVYSEKIIFNINEIL